MAKKTGIVAQVEKLVSDRAYLRSTISTMIAVARDAPGSLAPGVVDELKKALDRTAD